MNSNTVRPQVSPLGLEYVGHALVNAGIPVELLDLAFEPRWREALVQALSKSDPLAVGIAVRNTDDCCLATGKSFMPWVSELVGEVKRHTSAPVILGGVGFSIFPGELIQVSGADMGIYGDGEDAATLLAEALVEGGGMERIPNLVYRDERGIQFTFRSETNIRLLPLPLRRLVDNPRYQREGAMVGIETKRGCPNVCLYCADPVAKGRTTRLRPPETVVDEIEDLLAQGVSWYHLCDSEFNIPCEHAKSVCREIIRRRLAGRISWYTYCSPLPFDQELADLMNRAGCTGVNFGVDALHDGQLGRLARDHRVKDLKKLVECLQREGLNFIFDLLLGGPGETEKTVRTSIEMAQRLDLPLVGIALGVRVYPGTGMARLLEKGRLSDGMHPNSSTSLWEPVFYLSPDLGEDPQGLVHNLIGDDSRFMLLVSPEDEDSYNYVDDGPLSIAIEQGARGAYWDILGRKRREDRHPPVAGT
ncbi:B12-binding domain-containing radical SAM protein [Chloroflexota bacterium]